MLCCRSIRNVDKQAQYLFEILRSDGEYFMFFPAWEVWRSTLTNHKTKIALHPGPASNQPPEIQYFYTGRAVNICTLIGL